MLPADQTVDVELLDADDHEYSVKLRNAAPVVAPQPELKLEALKKAEADADKPVSAALEPDAPVKPEAV